MKEFIVLICPKGIPILQLPIERQQSQLEHVSKFIAAQVESGKMKNPQPFEAKGLSATRMNRAFQNVELHAGARMLQAFTKSVRMASHKLRKFLKSPRVRRYSVENGHMVGNPPMKSDETM